MRVSGRGKSESLLFLAPAGLFGIFFVWTARGSMETKMERELSPALPMSVPGELTVLI